MKHPAFELKNLSTEQNFALATLCKQKECLQQWLKYLNVKNIYMPEEVEKYRKRVSEINDAIKILEDELAPQSGLSEKNLRSRSSRQTKPATKKITPSQSNRNSPIRAANVADVKKGKTTLRAKTAFADN